MGEFIDLSNKKLGNLFVIKQANYRIQPNGSKISYWLCKCDCGNTIEVSGGNLRSGHTKSCGCYARKQSSKRMKEKNPGKKHGLWKSRLWNIWGSMNKRCYLKTHVHYKNYGGRGIRVCDEWLNKENGLINFYNWAMTNGYRDDLTIDRINPDGNYEPNNCRWITRKEQNNNKRNNKIIEYDGHKYTMTNLARKFNIDPNRFAERLRNGWTIEKALNTPIRKRG